jgi:tRNA(Arg) A34 adenosine deaminase TadA
MKSDAENLDPFFDLAFNEALAGIENAHGGPFGAVIVKDGKVIGKGHNTVLRDNDPTAHAEVNAIRDACKNLKSPHLEGCTLIASSEPCPMCLTTSYWAQISKIVYATPRQVAAEVGFADDFIYQDLAKDPSVRSISVTWAEKQAEKGKKIFRDWQAGGGKLY